MTAFQIAGIVLVLLAVAAAFFLRRVAPAGIIPDEYKPDRFHELEVKVRMAQGREKMVALHELGVLYLRQDDLYSTDNYLAQALHIGESEFGVLSPELIPMLKDYSKLMAKMGRRRESQTIDERIQSIERKAVERGHGKEVS